MGLNIQTGVLADLIEHDPEGADWMREDLAVANACLASIGAVHEEPETLPPMPGRAQLRGLPYSWIHLLRYAYVRRASDPGWTATVLPEGFDATDDALVLGAGASHLVNHSDADGFYFPIDFAEVLICEEGPVGSSYRLQEELCTVAPALGIALDDGALSDAEAARLNQVVERAAGLYRELAAWLALFEAARLSIAHRTAVVFG